MFKEISFFKFLKFQKTSIFGLIISFIIFLLLFFAFKIRMDIVLYGFFISIIVILIYSYTNYYSYNNKLKFVGEFLENDELKFTEKLEDEISKKLVEKIEEIKVEKIKNSADEIEKNQHTNEFYTLWTHQIKTPVAALNLLLEEENLDRKILKQEVLKIDDYINMILAYTKQASPSTDYVFNEVSLDKIIRSSIRKYSNIFIGKNLKLEYAGTDKKVISDEKWLEFIVDQILLNSLKYTENGEIEIKVQDMTLSIRDSGIGIESYDLPRVFELGYTGYNGRIYKKSSGIGLNLVKNIADKLDIEISISSKVGEYTEVSLKFKKN